MSEIGEIPVNPGKPVKSSERSVGSRIGGAAEIAVDVATHLVKTVAQDIIAEQERAEQQRIEQTKLNAARVKLRALLDEVAAPRHRQTARESQAAGTHSSDRAELALSQDEFIPGSTGYSSTELAHMRANRQPFVVNQEAWQHFVTSYEKFNGQMPPAVDTSRGRYLYQHYVVNAYTPWKEEAARAGQLMGEREHRLNKQERGIDAEYFFRMTRNTLDNQEKQPGGLTTSQTEAPATHKTSPVQTDHTPEPVAAPQASSSSSL